MLRATVAAFVFVATTIILLVALCGTTYLLLDVLVGDSNSWALAFAVVIYSPVVALYLVIGVAVGLWLSRRAYRRLDRGEMTG